VLNNNNNNNNKFHHLLLSTENNYILQLGTIIINEASVLESFLSGFWHGRQVIFRNFGNSKKIN
jgi:hypothetical protein